MHQIILFQTFKPHNPKDVLKTRERGFFLLFGKWWTLTCNWNLTERFDISSPTGDSLPNPGGEEKAVVGGEKQEWLVVTHKALSACCIISPQRTTEAISHAHLPDKVCLHKQKYKTKRRVWENKMTKRSRAPSMFWPFITFLYKMTDKTQRQWRRERQEISWRKEKG